MKLFFPAGGADCHPETVLSGHFGKELQLLDNQVHSSELAQHYDGTAQMLQSSFPHFRCIITLCLHTYVIHTHLEFEGAFVPLLQ